jgi:pimeloyl-ACP methyl ester carboxylesterase
MDMVQAPVRPAVIFVPGGIMPAELAYGPLLETVGGEIRPVIKDLEIYVDDTPPSGYGLGVEVEGIERAAARAGLDRFHLVGYSAGGASSLAFTARHPERVRSLALIEPAWIGNEGLTTRQQTEWEALARVTALPPDEMMAGFLRWQMRPGVTPPQVPLPPGPPPAWMAKRPAGIEALARAFKAYDLDRRSLRRFQGPAYYALGSLSTVYYEDAARLLTEAIPGLLVEVYEGRSHLDPPHRAEPERFARALRALWARGEELREV